MTPVQKKILIVLIALAVLSPIGLYLPMKFNADDAWGEWSVAKVEKMLGYAPEGMKKGAEVWKAPVPDYNLGDGKSPFALHAFSYAVSGVIGIALCAAAWYGLSKILVKKDK